MRHINILIFFFSHTVDQSDDDESEYGDIEGGKGKEKEPLHPVNHHEGASTIIYQASSPDEGALVTATRHLGYFFHVSLLPGCASSF